MKREAKFQILFRAWYKSFGEYWMGNAAIELKQTPKNSISLSCVEEHQINALLAVKNGSLLYKISDESRGKKPFDMFSLSNAGAYVVIKYPDRFCVISIDKFLQKKDELLSCKIKSLSVENACKISVINISLKK